MDETIEKEQVQEIPATSTVVSLLTDLHKVLDEARNMIVKYQQLSNAIDQREKNVFEREISVTSRENGIMEREEACNRVENVQKIHSDAQALINTSNLRVEAAVAAEKQLKESSSVETAKLTDLRAVTKREAEAVEKQRKSIDEEVAKQVNDFLVKHGFKKD